MAWANKLLSISCSVVARVGARCTARFAICTCGPCAGRGSKAKPALKQTADRTQWTQVRSDKRHERRNGKYGRTSALGHYQIFRNYEKNLNGSADSIIPE